MSLKSNEEEVYSQPLNEISDADSHFNKLKPEKKKGTKT